jgi:endonuclease YncB( thermonuclease family)
MIRLLREMVRELVRLPLAIKVLVGVAIAIEFVVITQWDNLNFKSHPAPPAPKVASTVTPPDRPPFDFPEAPPAVKAQAAAVEAALSKRMARIVIDDPKVQADGSIIGNGETLYLYGIKPFNSKMVCTKPSGEKWACGLHAYATLRNTLVHKTIVCDPKKILPNSISAVCHLGPADVAAMLAHDGLVELDADFDDPDLAAAQSYAKSRKLGVWDR